MKLLALVLSFGAVVFARPDVSHLPQAGYNYKPPTTSYGVPIDVKYDSSAQHHHHQHVPSGSYLPGQQLPQVHGRVDFLSGAGGSIINGQYDGYNPHLIQDQKHVYYYAAPDDEEQPRLRIHITPNNQRNTNVVFVKTPSYPALIPEVIAPVSQAEEKTKVIVLVKKPEQPAPISIPAPIPIKSKPEVYVVKYKDQHEAERVISAGNGGHPIGINVHQLGDEASFIKTLTEDTRAHLPHNDKYSGFDGNVDFFGVRSSGENGNVDGSSLLGSTADGSRGSGSVGSFGVSGGSDVGSSISLLDSTKGDSHVSGSLDSFGVRGESDHSGSLSLSGVDGESDNFGVLGGSSSLDSTKSASQGSGSFSSSLEVTGGSKDGVEFDSPILTSVSSGSRISTTGGRVGSDGADDFSSSSLLGSIPASSHKSSGDSSEGGSLHTKYGPPGVSGPY